MLWCLDYTAKFDSRLSQRGILIKPTDNQTVCPAWCADSSISLPPAVISTSGRIDAEVLRLLFYHAHRESEEFFRLAGQLAQPNQDSVFSTRAAFFDSLKNKVGHILAMATALGANLDLVPSVRSAPRPPARNAHAPQIYARDLSSSLLPWRMSARLALSSRSSP